jgi:hypothetical protein
LSSVLLVSQAFAQEAAVDYWDMSSASHRGVVDGLRALPSPEVRTALHAVLQAPHDPAVARTLEWLLAAQQQDQATRAVLLDALRADALGRLAAHLGERFESKSDPVSVDDALGLFAPRATVDQDPRAASTTIVIPFRDRTPDRTRLRNLLAVLASLEDQSADRSEYRVVVAEGDDSARWEHLLRPRVDVYLHVADAGHFNKSWVVNTAVVQAAAGSEVICVLDGDILVDRDFVRRNTARFTARGAQAHLPFRDALCLTADSSSRAIRRRLSDGLDAPPPQELNGVVLRRPPGHVVWVRRGLFDRVGGFDERFTGWGGEDLDFVFRLDIVGAVDRYGDDLFHLWHDRPQTQIDGHRFYAGRRLLSWRPAAPVGSLAGPVSSLDDDLAGLIEHASILDPS